MSNILGNEIGFTRPVEMAGEPLKNVKVKGLKSGILNNRAFYNYYERLKNMALSMFEWHNLPDSCNQRWLELSLFEMGYCLFFNDPVMGYLTLNCSIGGQLSIYREPTLYRPITPTGIVFPEYTIDDSVLIFNNMTWTNTEWIIIQFAERLAKLERTIDINVNAQKTPWVYYTDEKTRLSIVNMMKQIDEFETAIIANKTFNPDTLTVLKTEAPLISDKLQQIKQQIWNEAMTFLGIDNANTFKKERLITSEVESNGAIDSSREVMLEARRLACERINRMFGLDIWVDFKKTELIDQKEESEIENDEREDTDNE